MSVNNESLTHYRLSERIAYSQFKEAVKDMNEAKIVQYVKENPPSAFLSSQQAIKIRKVNPNKESTSDRSNKLQRSIVVLANGIIFPSKSETTLGKGQTKTWKKGTDLGTNQDFAIAQSSKKEVIQSMKKEHEITSRLNPEHVVQVACFTRKGTKVSHEMGYAVAELCQGTLKEAMKANRSLTRPQWFQIHNAYQHCHEEGIAHVDGHEENLLVSKDGTIKLSDFEGAIRQTDVTPAVYNKVLERDEWYKKLT